MLTGSWVTYIVYALCGFALVICSAAMVANLIEGQLGWAAIGAGLPIKQPYPCAFALSELTGGV